MLRPPPFPICPEDLTADVLSVGLGHPVESFKATRIGANRGMLGVTMRVDVVYGGGVAGPSPVVTKFAALREGSLASARRGGTHERELRFYDELARITPVRTPAFHAAWYDPDTAHFLLLQEMIDADEQVDQVAGVSVDRVRLVLTEVARLHATWWGNPRLKGLDWLPPPDSPRRKQNLGAMAADGWRSLCDMLGPELDAEEQALGDGLPDRVEAMLAGLAAAPETMLHGDLRADNLLFSAEGDSVTLVDWQGLGRGPAGWDLAYLMSQCLTVDDRQVHEAELLDHYRVELADAGCQATAEEVREGYAEAMLFGLVIACALPLISDEDEERVVQLAGVFARRSIEALRDHDQLWPTGP